MDTPSSAVRATPSGALEVELRGFFSDEKEFNDRLAALRAIASSVEEDHRDTVFFMIKDATLKVARLNSKRRAKIAYKGGDIVRSKAQKEIEMEIPYDSYDDAIAMFVALGFSDMQLTQQVRYNLIVGEFEIAMKWSKDWGYHFEAEKVVCGETEAERAELDLAAFCHSHHLRALSEAEFEAFRTAVDTKHAARP
jgi:adenylate cyclase class IV